MSRATKRDPKHLQGWVSTCSMKLELEYAKAFFVAMMRMVWWEEKYVMVSSNVSIAIMMGVVGMAERQVGGHEWITGHFRLKADPPLLLHTAHIGIIIHAHAHLGITIITIKSGWLIYRSCEGGIVRQSVTSPSFAP